MFFVIKLFTIVNKIISWCEIEMIIFFKSPKTAVVLAEKRTNY